MLPLLLMEQIWIPAEGEQNVMSDTYPSGLQNSHVRLRDFNSLSADMRTLLLELFAGTGYFRRSLG